MPEATNPTPAAPGSQPSLTLKEIEATIATAVAAAVKPIADAQKAITDALTAEANAKAEAAKAEAAKKPADKTAEAKPLTAEDVAKLLSDTLNQRDAASKTTAAREAFIADKLKGVPAVYATKLGSDPAKWATEEQAIRDGLKADLAALGVTPKTVDGETPGGTTAASGTVGTAALSLAQLKAQGLSEGEASFASTLKMPATA